MHRILTVAFALVLVSRPLHAASPEELDALRQVLGVGDLIAIVSDEGKEQGEDLRNEIFPGRAGDGWSHIVSEIYETDRLSEVFRAEFDLELGEADIAPVLAFYDAEVGRKVQDLEVEARRAIGSDEVEAAAEEAYEALVAKGGTRVSLFDEFVRVNGLVDRNVSGAMNSSLAFYRGLEAGGGFTLGESEILREIWSQEADIRADTEVWVNAYMTLAYEPLTDAELGDYLAFTTTEAGRALNRALFAGFYGVFDHVSFLLGEAASTYMGSEEL